MIGKLGLVLLMAATLAGCKTTGAAGGADSAGDSWQPRQSYLSYLVCIDYVATSKIKEGSSVRSGASAGIEACKKDRDRYVEELISEVKARNGWSSVRPDVRPAVRVAIEKATLNRVVQIIQYAKAKGI